MTIERMADAESTRDHCVYFDLRSAMPSEKTMEVSMSNAVPDGMCIVFSGTEDQCKEWMADAIQVAASPNS